MPSELKDSHGLSPSSFLTEEVQHPNERQIGFRKADGMPDNFGLKDGKVYAVGDSSESHIPNLYRSQDHHNKVHISSLLENNNTVGAVGHSFRNNDKGNRSNLNMEHNKYYHTAMGDHYENGLFSSSLSDLFTRKLRVSANNSSSMYGHGHSVGAAGGYEEEEPFESLEEIEAQTIGNLLPDDEDLLSGVTDGLDCKVQQGDDVEELDFFSSVGGMELGEDGGGQKNNYAEQQPNGESPSRTLFVRNINSNVEDSELRILFEQYGEIRTLYTACKHRGFVMISYYDIRAARRAMQALQNKPLRRRKLDIHYSIPKDNPSDKDTNQGTVVIFNGLDFNVSNDELGRIFGVYGEVKEIHEGGRHKSIEFYDIRAAEAAVRELNKSEIGGKQMKLEPSSRPPTKRFSSPFPELDPDETSALLHMCSTTADGSMDNGTALLGVPPTAAQQLFDAELQHGIIPSTGFSSIIGGGGVESGMSQLKYDFRTPLPNYHHHHHPHPHPHSLPDNNNILCNSPSTMAARISGNRQQQFNRIGGRSLELNDTVFGSSGNASSHPYNMMWNPSHQQQQATHNMMWPNSPSFMNGAHSAPLVHAVPRAPSHVAPAPNTFLHINNHHHHHVGSAPSVNPSSIWDRRHSYAAGESPDFHPGSLGNMRVSPLDFVSPHNMFPPHMGDMPIPSKTIHHHNSSTVMFPSRGGGQMMMGSFDSSSDRARIRSRNEGTSNQLDSKKQFELDLDRIMRAEDRRTTLMIKNIPNKYTSKMLLAAIDERHRGTYDFIYLPIDFKNKCNVGYAFINMTDPSLIIPFYQAFNGKKWEKFNSEKVASLAYARIQGKAALIAHFQNSSLMNEDKRCRPILFHTDGPNAGDQVPFPMGVNVRSRVNKNRNSSTNDESSQDVGNGEASSNGGDSSSGSTKDFELC